MTNQRATNEEKEQRINYAADQLAKGERSMVIVKKLSKLTTPFRNDGSVTAGNSSGVNDGAAALIIASEDAIRKNNLKPIARIVNAASSGVEPRIMGMGPVSATEKVLKKSNIKLNQIDTVEINEAFAAQVLACTRELGIQDDDPRINPNGGAIALWSSFRNVRNKISFVSV